MADETAAVPASESTLNFNDVEIATATLDNGLGYVSLNSLCDAFGLDRRGQRNRLTSPNSFYAQYQATLRLTTPGGPQPALCLRAEVVPFFLAGVNLSLVKKEETRELLQAFMEVAKDVLAEHFGLSEESELRFNRQALMFAVAQQEALEGKIGETAEEVMQRLNEQFEGRIDRIREVFLELRSDVRSLQRVAGPKNRISPEELGQLRETVKRLALLQQEHESIAKPFPGIYAEVYALAGVSRAEHIPKKALPGILTYLDDKINVILKRVEGGGKRKGKK